MINLYLRVFGLDVFSFQASTDEPDPSQYGVAGDNFELCQEPEPVYEEDHKIGFHA